MNLSFQPANKAELRVDIGKTSLESLQKFQADAAAKGGGELRARKNDDGSFTLYVPANNKIRLGAVFQGYGQAERTQKQELAKDLVTEIISRRLPADGKDNSVGKTTQGLLGDINRPNSQGKTLPATVDGLTRALDKTWDSAKLELADRLANPQFHASLKDFLVKDFASENLNFIDAANGLKRAAEEFAPASGPGAAAENQRGLTQLADQAKGILDTFVRDNSANQVNLKSVNRETAEARLAQIQQDIADLQNPGPDDRASSIHERLKTLLDESKGEILHMVGSDKLPRFKRTPEGAEAWRLSSRENMMGAAGTLAARAEQGIQIKNAVVAYQTSGQLDLDATAKAGGMNEKSVTLQDRLAEPAFHAEFKSFLAGEFSTENLNFFDAAKRLRGDAANPAKELPELARLAEQIVNDFVVAGAANQVNLPGKMPGATRAALDQIKRDIADLQTPGSDDRASSIRERLKTLLAAPQGEIVKLMNKDSFQRFHGSEAGAAAVKANNVATARQELLQAYKQKVTAEWSG